jgi:hypothetical protein
VSVKSACVSTLDVTGNDFMGNGDKFEGSMGLGINKLSRRDYVLECRRGMSRVKISGLC